MATLGNILPLEDDELLFSYIYRLLRENGYETTGDVYETLFQHHTKYSSTHQIRYDTFEDLIREHAKQIGQIDKKTGKVKESVRDSVRACLESLHARLACIFSAIFCQNPR